MLIVIPVIGEIKTLQFCMNFILQKKDSYKKKICYGYVTDISVD